MMPFPEFLREVPNENRKDDGVAPVVSREFPQVHNRLLSGFTINDTKKTTQVLKKL